MQNEGLEGAGDAIDEFTTNDDRLVSRWYTANRAELRRIGEAVRAFLTPPPRSLCASRISRALKGK